MPPAGNIRPIADDQIIDAVIARSIQTDAERTHPMLAWVIIRDEEFYPGQFMARLVTNTLTPLRWPTRWASYMPNFRLDWSGQIGSRWIVTSEASAKYAILLPLTHGLRPRHLVDAVS